MSSIDITTKLKRQRSTITRRKLSLDRALTERDQLVRQALELGVGPTKLSKLTGLHVSRISQIKNEEP